MGPRITTVVKSFVNDLTELQVSSITNKNAITKKANFLYFETKGFTFKLVFFSISAPFGISNSMKIFSWHTRANFMNKYRQQHVIIIKEKPNQVLGQHQAMR